MQQLKTTVLRSKYLCRRAFDRAYAWGAKWCRDGFQLTPDELRRKQLERLYWLIKRFSSRGLCKAASLDKLISSQDPDLLASLPVLDKQGLRQLYPILEKSYSGIRRIYAKLRGISTNSTGGSTGEPVEYLRSRLQDKCGAGASMEMLRVLGWRPGMQRVCLWGSERDIGLAEQPEGWLGNLVADTTVIGSYAPGEPEFRRFLEAVKSHRGCAVYGFTSLLMECSRTMIENGWELAPGQISAAWVGAEALADTQRSLFKQAFGIELRDHYGSRECSSIAAECEKGTRHINPRYIAEVVDPEDRTALPEGQNGLLLVTDLFNDVTPLIRYEIGDMGAIAWRECSCGRRGPCITSLAGRIAETFALVSGTKVSALFFNHLFKEFPAVHQFQVCRQTATAFELRYTGPGLSAADTRRLMDVTQRILEGAQVEVIHVPKLDRSPSGKLIQYRDLRENASS